jgi:broad specificity phosphatase PhoE
MPGDGQSAGLCSLRSRYSEWSAVRMTNSGPRVVLIRHGETAWSRDRRHTGRTDIPLTPHGEAQAAGLAHRLEGRKFAEVLVSPLFRATATAELAGLGGGEVTPDLVEWDYGDFEGRTTAAIRDDLPGWDLFTDGVPHGEYLHQVAARVDRVIARIRAGSGDVACVAHAHLLRVLAVRWLGTEPQAARYLVLGPASISVLGWERQQSVIEHWNT